MAKEKRIKERNTKKGAPEAKIKAKSPIDSSDKEAIRAAYTPYVRSIAGKLQKTITVSIELDKLIEFGMAGLLEAADDYDPKAQSNFMTFAYYRIRGAIFEGLRNMGHVSAAETAKMRFEGFANEYLADMQSPEGSSDNAFEKSVTDLASAVQGLASVYLLNMDSSSDSGDMAEARKISVNAIDKLNNQERKLMKLYYYKDMSLRDVANQLGLPKSRAARLHTRAIEKLHRLMEDELGHS